MIPWELDPRSLIRGNGTQRGSTTNLAGPIPLTLFSRHPGESDDHDF
ncbi:hypothetical protein RESH_00855 [Rhodopirellula europaea SH398]|uniref:Uncharacterized protein n=1 Tax=Rhodopirellula europaea SH398 TaxID=1263868 RepID=M5SQM8_9BACT|nr:hypothetical protein RESH_00855 [Rhodopirellula europaea SH398]